MSFSVVIPARYASTRLPAKPLLDIAGKSLIQRVYERSVASRAGQIIIATDDERILNAARMFGAQSEMTSIQWSSGTGRCAEIAQRRGWSADHIVVNVQGDEPLIPPTLIDQVAANLQAHPDAQVATLCAPINDIQDVFDTNIVKVVHDHQGYALYFSRAPIPWYRDAYAQSRQTLPAQANYLRHIGIYAYRCAFLFDYMNSDPCALESAESLEQLRVLWQGGKIHIANAIAKPGPGVDTPEDLARVSQLIRAQEKIS